MSHIPPDELTFTRVVEQAFLTLKGSGLMLSPKDIALARRWEQTGVPVRVVCRAIQQSFERHQRARGQDADPPRSLSYCAQAVESAVRTWRERMVGYNPPASGGDDAV